MVYSSVPITPSKEKNNDTSIQSIEKQSDFKKIPKLNHPPSLFSDKHGNLKFVKFIVRNPCLVFFIILLASIGMTIRLFQLSFKAGNPFTPDDNTYDLYDKRSLAYDGLRLAKEEVERLRESRLPVVVDTDGKSNEVKLQERLGDVTYWIYEAKTDQGLFTKNTLPIMRSAEIMFTKHKKYPQYCLLQYKESENHTTSECTKEFSIVNIFYASSWNSSVAQSIIEDLNESNIQMYNSVAACVELNMLCQYIPKEITVQDLQWAKSLNTRVNLMTKYWDGDGTLNDNIEEVSNLLAHLKELNTKAPLISFFVDGNFTVDNPVTMYSRSVVYWGSPLDGADDSTRNSKTSSGNLLKSFIIDNFLDQLKKVSSDNYNADIKVYYFMGTLIFDIIVDILVSDALKAVLSFVFVYFYLRIMIGSWFLATVGMLEIFLSLPLAWYFFSNVLGIKYFSTLNVLCLFIVAAIGADDIFVFMDAYRQSAQKEELLESMETRMSWVYRRSGNAMLITSTTTCFAFLCTILSPIAGTRSFGIFAALVIFFDYILVMTLFCTAVVIFHDRLEAELGWCCSCFCCVKNDPNPTQIALSKMNNGERPPENRISFFFREKFAPFILLPRNRLLIFVPMLSWLILTSWYTSKLSPTQTAEQALSKDHPLQRGATILNEKFPKVQQDRGTYIHFIWGLKDVNRNGVSQLFDPTFVGTPSFSNQFDFSEKCQEKMLATCDSMKTNDKFKTLIKTQKDGLRNVQCFVEDLGAFNALGSLTNCGAVKSGDWKNQTWTVAEDNIHSTTKSITSQKSCSSSDTTVGNTYKDSLGWDGETLRYVGISIESSVLDPYSTLPEEKVREHYDSFIQIAQDLDSEMEYACSSKVLVTDLDQKFIFMNNQKIYRTSAVSGSMIGVLIAFIVLLVSTRKFHIAFFATVSIFSVLLSVIGSTTMMGWTLGTNEAILISILAGFSVDYVVHLAHAYVHANGSTEKRITEAFGDMGISVFSGMLTSVVASIPLFMCTLVFFAKFGIFLCFTIMFSWIFANFGFMSLLGQAKIRIRNKKG